MSDRVVLGAQEGGARLVVDLPTLVDSRALITGNSGAGKSRLLRRLCEQAFGKVQILVIDPEGEFSTLRERHAFLLAGRGGEIPAESRAAGLMARRLMELRASAVLDLYDLKLPQRRAFVRAFLESLLELPRDQYRPALIVIDEAQLFCPEKGYGEAESSEAVIALMTQGRKRGLCGIPATQRLAAFDKTAAAQATNVFVGRTVLDVDQKRAAAVLGITSSAERVALRDLPLGVFLAYGPAIVASGVVKFQGGDVETTHPKAGQRHAATAPPAPDAVRKIAAELKDLPEAAAEEIRTLQAAQARIRGLEGELRAAKKAQPPAPPAPKTVEKNVVAPKLVRRVEQAIARMDGQAERLTKEAQRLVELHADVRARQSDLKAALAAATDAPKGPAHVRATVGNAAPAASAVGGGPGRGHLRAPGSSRPAPAVPRESGGALGSGERAVLTAIAQHGDDGVTREQLSILTGYKRSSRDTYLQRLRAAGLVAEEGRGIVATPEGFDVLGPSFQPLPTGDALREHWLGSLPEGERRVFEAIVAAYPNGITREAIDEATGYKRSSRDTYLQRLGARRLITTQHGAVRAAKELFG